MASLTIASLLRATAPRSTLVSVNAGTAVYGAATPVASRKIHTRLSSRRVAYTPRTVTVNVNSVGFNTNVNLNANPSLRVAAAAFSTSARSAFGFTLALREPKRNVDEDADEDDAKPTKKSSSSGSKKSGTKTKKSTTTKAGAKGKTGAKATTTGVKKAKAGDTGAEKKPRRASAAAKKKVPKKKKVVKKKRVAKKAAETKPKIKITRAILPPKRPLTAFMQFWNEYIEQRREAVLDFEGAKKEAIMDLHARAMTVWKGMSEEEKQPYVEKYLQQKKGYEIASKEYFENTSKDVLKAINKRNKKLGKMKIIDPYRQRRIPGAFILFHRERLQKLEVKGNVIEEAKASAALWKEVSVEEKKRYIELAKEMREKQASS